MSKKEIDLRFHFPYKNVNRCRKCNGLLEYQAQAGSMPPSIHCVECGFRDWDVIRSAQRGAEA